MKASKLRALAAALETPGDLTEQELKEAHDDIVEVLLGFADEKDEEERYEKIKSQLSGWLDCKTPYNEKEVVEILGVPDNKISQAGVAIYTYGKVELLFTSMAGGLVGIKLVRAFAGSQTRNW